MRKLLKKQGFAPSHLVTDHLKSYPSAFHEMGLTAVHHRGKRMNNRAESSDVPIRRRERKMQGFKSAKSAQRFLSAHGSIYVIADLRSGLVSLHDEALDDEDGK